MRENVMVRSSLAWVGSPEDALVVWRGGKEYQGKMTRKLPTCETEILSKMALNKQTNKLTNKQKKTRLSFDLDSYEKNIILCAACLETMIFFCASLFWNPFIQVSVVTLTFERDRNMFLIKIVWIRSLMPGVKTT